MTGEIVKGGVGRPTRPFPASPEMSLGNAYMVSSGHRLASLAGTRILEQGGNAVDAGVAAGLALNVVQSDMTNIGGVAPILVFEASSGRVFAISGVGWWPMAATADFFHRHHGGHIPVGVHRCVVPAALDAWLTALEEFGTLSFSEVVTPAIELAADGFPMHPWMFEMFSDPAYVNSVRTTWPLNNEIFFREGRPRAVGDLVVQADLAMTLTRLAEAESPGRARGENIQAVRERFYRGDIAEEMTRFVREAGGWLTLDDLAAFRVEIEPAPSTTYRDYEIYSAGFWCQGPVVLQTLNILEGFDVAGSRSGSAATYHLVLESLKASFADRDRYYGDPRHLEIPIDGLLSKEYAEERRSRLNPKEAWPEMPPPGDPWRFSNRAPTHPDQWEPPLPTEGVVGPDTSYVCVVDEAGNAFSATPSDGAIVGPLIPGLGFMISTRGQQSWSDPRHPNAIAPGKRPRLTPSPGIALSQDCVVAFGTPGGDMQPQVMVQFLVNGIDFGMSMQQAIDAPRCGTFSYPASDSPHAYYPGLVRIESRVEASVVRRLVEMGHRIELWPEWSGMAGNMSAVMRQRHPVQMHGAADPRRSAYAAGC